MSDNDKFITLENLDNFSKILFDIFVETPTNVPNSGDVLTYTDDGKKWKTPIKKISDLINDKGFVDKNVTDLASYSTTSQMTTAINSAVYTKQNRLTPGDNITIQNNVISSNQPLPFLNGDSESSRMTSSSTIYAPTQVGSQGQILSSSGTGSPVWVNAPTGTVEANPTLSGNEEMLKSIKIGDNLYNTEYIKEITTRNIRITDLDTGIYKLTNNSKHLFYNGSTNTDYIVILGDIVILTVTKYTSVLQTYWTWECVESTSRAQLYVGETNITTGSYVQRDYVIDNSYHNLTTPIVSSNTSKDIDHIINLSNIIPSSEYSSVYTYEIFCHIHMYYTSAAEVYLWSDSFSVNNTSNANYKIAATTGNARVVKEYAIIPASSQIHYKIVTAVPSEFRLVIYGYRRIS